MKSPIRVSRIIWNVVALVVMLLLGGVIGWRVGMRDGIGLACSEVSGALRTYHLAAQKGDSKVKDQTIERLTEVTVSQLVDSDVRSQLLSVVPYHSQQSMASLKQVWQPSPRAVLLPLTHYPHTPKGRDYRAAFAAIPVAKGEPKYAPYFAE